MADIKMITTALNNYFINNRIMIGNEIPKEGEFIIGDIMIKETQVSGEAIGWICVASGNPAAWSEFGKMPIEEIELEDGSVNIAKLADDVKLKLSLIDGLKTNQDNIQHEIEGINNVIEEKVGENIGDLTTLTTSDQSNLVNAINEVKYNLDNIDLTPYATNEKVDNINSTLTDNINNVNNTIGDASTLQTNTKDNIVSAINEVFQSGVSVKENLVEALTSKDVECSTSNTFDELISEVENLPVFPIWARNGGGLSFNGAPLITAGRRMLTSAVLGTDIYVLSGYTGSTSNLNTKYDTLTNTWTAMQAINYSTYGAAAVECGGKIYHLGGYNYTAYNRCYDPTTNTWSNMTNLTTGKQYASAVTVDGKIYIGTGNNTAMLSYDPSTNAWTTLAVGYTNQYSSAAYFNGQIHFFGGSNSNTAHYVYNIASNTWTSSTALHVTMYRSGQSAMIYNGKVYMVGGTIAGTTSNLVISYDIANNIWATENVTIGIAVYSPTTQIVNGTMYCIGGYSSTYLKDNQMIMFE